MDEKTEIMRVLTEYYKVFSTLNLQAIAPYFTEPSLLMGPGGVAAMPTHAVLITFFTAPLDGLRARGYGRSELSLHHYEQLSPVSALVVGTANRFKTDGQELERAGVTYLMQKVDGKWKIAVLVAGG